jgi:hypothetical protein
MVSGAFMLVPPGLDLEMAVLAGETIWKVVITYSL